MQEASGILLIYVSNVGVSKSEISIESSRETVYSVRKLPP